MVASHFVHPQCKFLALLTPDLILYLLLLCVLHQQPFSHQCLKVKNTFKGEKITIEIRTGKQHAIVKPLYNGYSYKQHMQRQKII
jgi:hypothetical protein